MAWLYWKQCTGSFDPTILKQWWLRIHSGSCMESVFSSSLHTLYLVVLDSTKQTLSQCPSSVAYSLVPCVNRWKEETHFYKVQTGWSSGVNVDVMFYLRICWQKCSLCSGVRWELGKPGGRRASLSHTDSMLGQLWLTENKTSAKCSARLRGDWPPMACIHSEIGPYILNIYLVFFGYIILYEVNVPKTLPLPLILHTTKILVKNTALKYTSDL